MILVISFLIIGIFILVLQFIDKKITENQDRLFYENEELLNQESKGNI
jgi:regulatory protein YycI of two-component signal transduction system YycFG